MQFVVFEKIYECLFIPNCTRKIIWLLVNNIQVTISVTLQHFTWQMKATSQLLQLYWIKIWHVNSSVKIHSLSPSHVWKLRSFFELWKAVFTHSWILKNLTTKQSKNSLACGLDAAFFSNVFRVVEKLWAVFTPRRNYSTQHKLLKPEYQESKLKSTRKRIFLALKDNY